MERDAIAQAVARKLSDRFHMLRHQQKPLLYGVVGDRFVVASAFVLARA
jgi:hypothetical protein